jgi:hypothetical protein
MDEIIEKIKIWQLRQVGLMNQMSVSMNATHLFFAMNRIEDRSIGNIAIRKEEAILIRERLNCMNGFLNVLNGSETDTLLNRIAKLERFDFRGMDCSCSAN